MRHGTPTCLFSEEVRVAAVMAHVAVKHIIGHKGKTGPVEKEKGKRLHHETCQHFISVIIEHMTIHTQCRCQMCLQ